MASSCSGGSVSIMRAMFFRSDGSFLMASVAACCHPGSLHAIDYCSGVSTGLAPCSKEKLPPWVTSQPGWLRVPTTSLNNQLKTPSSVHSLDLLSPCTLPRSTLPTCICCCGLLLWAAASISGVRPLKAAAAPALLPPPSPPEAAKAWSVMALCKSTHQPCEA